MPPITIPRKPNAPSHGLANDLSFYIYDKAYSRPDTALAMRRGACPDMSSVVLHGTVWFKTPAFQAGDRESKREFKGSELKLPRAAPPTLLREIW